MARPIEIVPVKRRDRTMSLMVLDERVAEQLLAERRAWGGDHHDEVWDGVSVVPKSANQA
jgi:hypothetical protein